jgi:phage-related protein
MGVIRAEQDKGNNLCLWCGYRHDDPHYDCTADFNDADMQAATYPGGIGQR